MKIRRGHHDRQRVSRGLDGLVTLACECGQVWPCADEDEAHSSMLRHALHPNVGDPRRPLRTEPTDVDPRSIVRPSWMDAYADEPSGGSVLISPDGMGLRRPRARERKPK